ncbi:hypothetical protein MSM1_19610 [Mycobacterium sp. SM1]|uniref:hypothetical protein n=1 Tax=Mycobacterium sp. SM1 TaxID=2816243 RepID=UPI001BD04D14|nr:hypothetical protein [Mycobacterium sp. SM1]MBS4730433.1 hypothetical protein [Mycobacterium sp. SM1]
MSSVADRQNDMRNIDRRWQTKQTTLQRQTEPKLQDIINRSARNPPARPMGVELAEIVRILDEDEYATH